MIEQRARVISTSQGRAELLAEATAGCGSCKAGGCNASIFGRIFGLKMKSFWMDNPVGARAGDQVIVALDPTALQLSSITLYLTPLVGLIASAAIATSFFHLEEPFVILIGLLGAVIGLLLARYIGDQQALKDRWQLKILRIVQSAAPFDSSHPQA